MLFRLARRKARQIEKKYLSYLHWSWPRTVAQLLRKGSSTLEQAEEHVAGAPLEQSSPAPWPRHHQNVSGQRDERDQKALLSSYSTAH